jgi:hypothetical protein
MQLTAYKPKFFEKWVTTPEGVYLARFVLIAEGNSLKAKLLELVPIASDHPLVIEAPKINAPDFSYIIEPTKIISPFSNFEFFTSQPTRAPSLS